MQGRACQDVSFVSSCRLALDCMKVDNIKPQVDPFVFPVRDGVSVLASGRLLNFGLRHWPSFLLDLVFLHETGAVADLLRYCKETTACKNAKDGGDEKFLVRRARVRDDSASAR